MEYKTDEYRAILLGNKIAAQLTPSNEAMKAIRLLREELCTTLREVREETRREIREEIASRIKKLEDSEEDDGTMNDGMYSLHQYFVSNK